MKFPYKTLSKGSYSLKNVRLETGFEYDDQEVIRTKTDLFCIEVENGKIKAVVPNNPNSDAIDMEGKLMLPAFKDLHCHLDKTLYGLPWQAVSPKRKTVKEMIAYEQEIIPELLKTSVERSEQLIHLLQHFGTTSARSHFNVDPTSGLKSLENLEQALKNNNDSFEAELVAFPQHGLYYTDSVSLMKEAASHESVGFIGGLDPFSIDGSVEKPLDFTVQLALDHSKGIDLHLHEIGDSGMKTIRYLIDKVNENPELKGKVVVSHAFALGHLSMRDTEEIAERLAGANIGIASSIPFYGTIMPIPMLKKYGVTVLIGNDNVQDHWSTFGTGNILQKANLIAELYGYTSEFDLSRTLSFATQNSLPLDDEGNQQWPKTGDSANLLFFHASCSAEVVSRMPQVEALAIKETLFCRRS